MLSEAEEGVFPFLYSYELNLISLSEAIHFQNVVTTFNNYAQYSVRPCSSFSEKTESETSGPSSLQIIGVGEIFFCCPWPTRSS